MARSYLLLLVGLLLGPIAGAAAAPRAPRPQPARPTRPPASADPEALPYRPADLPSRPVGSVVPVDPARYRMGAGDQVRVEVVGHPEFTSSSTITRRGTLLLPILHEVEVEGLTVDEVQEKLAGTLRDGYVRDPRVLVQMVEYNNMKIWVFGYVAQPGELRLTGPTRILHLLSLVGDRGRNAAATLTIERSTLTEATDADGKVVPRTEADTLTVDLDALLRLGDLSQNLELRNGDKVYFPSSSAKVGVFGEVLKPGFYPYRDGMSLSELVALAGGMTEFANPKKVRIKRQSLPKPIQVNLKSYYKDGDVEANAPLQEGDLVVVNSSFLF